MWMKRGPRDQLLVSWSTIMRIRRNWQKNLGLRTFLSSQRWLLFNGEVCLKKKEGNIKNCLKNLKKGTKKRWNSTNKSMLSRLRKRWKRGEWSTEQTGWERRGWWQLWGGTSTILMILSCCWVSRRSLIYPLDWIYLFLLIFEWEKWGIPVQKRGLGSSSKKSHQE